METATTTQNWISGTTHLVLDDIHEEEINIAIYKRMISSLEDELNHLIKRNIEFRSSGALETVVEALSQEKELMSCPLLKEDIKDLFMHFSKISNATNYRLFLATVKSNMCRKFHTDINDLRMLCTYKGPGTLWLTEENVNREAEDHDHEGMILDKSKIQQARAGDVLLLKGAIYPKEGTKAILHRSPTIEEHGEERILLRIDTDEFANF